VKWVLALATAALLVLTVPRFDYSWLAPVALTPLLIAVHGERRSRMRFLQGWFAGALYWLAVCYWIQGVLEREGGLGSAGSWAALGLFAAAKGLHMAFFALGAGWMTGKWYTLPAIAALWTGLERTHGPLGFTWFLLGNAGIDMGVPMRLAPLVGVYGLSFSFAMMGAGVAMALMKRPRREAAWLLALPLLYLLPPVPTGARGAQQAVYVQPNVPVETEWTPEQREAINRRLESLSLSAGIRSGDPPARLIIWPETPAPLYYFEDPGLKARVATISRLTQSYVVAGVVGRTADGQPANSAVIVGPAGDPLDRYDKIRLVPFGEFVPPLFEFVNKITAEAGDFAPGNRVVVFQTGERKTGVFICYEAVFPDLVRQFAARGAEMLVNISNDGYFGRTAAREQHLKIARMRAAENRRWILRATNDGITATIDPSGRLTHAIEPYIATSVRTQFNYESRLTPYTRYGDWFAWGCLMFGAGVAAFHHRGRMRFQFGSTRLRISASSSRLR
jgi:apolipoprotein N-acyltransferase